MRSDQPGVQDDVADVDPSFPYSTILPSLPCAIMSVLSHRSPPPCLLGPHIHPSLSLGSDFWLSAWPSARISSMSVMVGTLPHRQLIAYHLGYLRGLLLKAWLTDAKSRKAWVLSFWSNKQTLSLGSSRDRRRTALDHLCLGLIFPFPFC